MQQSHTVNYIYNQTTRRHAGHHCTIEHKLEAKDALPNINHMQAAERAEK